MRAHEPVQFSIENTGIALILKLGSHWRRQRGSPSLSTRGTTGALPALETNGSYVRWKLTSISDAYRYLFNFRY